MGEALEVIDSQDAVGFFSHCGYRSLGQIFVIAAVSRDATCPRLVPRAVYDNGQTRRSQGPEDLRAGRGTKMRTCVPAALRSRPPSHRRKWVKKTAHVGRQWLANIGKTDSGVESVTSLFADERIYYPVAFEPYTPSHHFEGGKNDPHFRTKLKIASQLVEKAPQRSIPFRAVVADSFYGEDEGFKQSMSE
jgi:hypothetical protein